MDNYIKNYNSYAPSQTHYCVCLSLFSFPHKLLLVAGDGERSDVTGIAGFQLVRLQRGVMPN